MIDIQAHTKSAVVRQVHDFSIGWEKETEEAQELTGEPVKSRLSDILSQKHKEESDLGRHMTSASGFHRHKNTHAHTSQHLNTFISHANKFLKAC